MTALLADPSVTRPRRSAPEPLPTPRAAAVPSPDPERPLLLYGDFNCPWSYLASRRAAVLAAAGTAVDFRAVEHAPGAGGPGPVQPLIEEMDRVLARLLPGEELPYDLAGFVPRSRAAIAAYAEGYAAGVADAVRRVLFEAFWVHGIDIGQAHVLRTLLVDELRSGASPSETVREWGYGVDVTGGPISTAAWRLSREWADQWRRTEGAEGTVPLLVVPDHPRPYVGLDAVDWLGEQVAALEPEVRPATPQAPARPGPTDLPSITWASSVGGGWLRRFERFPARRGW